MHRYILLFLVCTFFAGDAYASVSDRMVRYARQELARGVREIPAGSNKSPDIRRYLTATVGSYYGAPWCAYFTSYIARRAGAPIGPGGKGMGYVPYIESWARQTGKWRTRPARGDLIIWRGHIGIVETTPGGAYVTTIEGNTSHAVLRRWRTISSARGFVRLAPFSPPSTPRPQPKPQPKPRPKPQPQPEPQPLPPIPPQENLHPESEENEFDDYRRDHPVWLQGPPGHQKKHKHHKNKGRDDRHKDKDRDDDDHKGKKDKKDKWNGNHPGRGHSKWDNDHVNENDQGPESLFRSDNRPDNPWE